MADVRTGRDAPVESAAAGERCARLIWDLVREPAEISVGEGRRLAMVLRETAGRLSRLVGAALAEAVGRKVGISWGAFRGTIRASFGVVLARGAGERCMMAFDLALCRAIAEAISTDSAAGLRGAGALTDVELGLLEYAALATLDRMDLEEGDLGGWRVAEFLDAGDIEKCVGEFNSGPLILELDVGLRLGSLAFWWTGKAETEAASSWVNGDDTGARESLTLRLALAGVTLSELEWEGVRPGDVLTLGVAEGARLGGSIIATTGWMVAAGVVEAWGAGLARVRWSSPGAAVFAAAFKEDRDGVVNLIPVVGRLEMHEMGFVSEFGDSSGILELPLPLDCPAELWRGTTRVAIAEMLTVDGELALRVLERFEVAIGGHDAK